MPGRETIFYYDYCNLKLFPMSQTNTLTQELLQSCIVYLEENMHKTTKALEHLEPSEIWWRPNSHSNSVGNLIVHLSGNIRQYIMATLGRQKDIRQRGLEFSQQGGLDRTELLKLLQDTVDEAIEILKNSSFEQLTAVYQVQAYEMTGAKIVIHVVEHFSYHTGQIILYTKWRKNLDLGFYNNLDLNQKHNT